MSALDQLLFVSLSGRLLDAHFPAAHVLKLFSYAIVCVGVILDAHRSNQRERLVPSELGRVNVSLNEKNLSLTSVRNDLLPLTKLAAIASSSVRISDHFEELVRVLRLRVAADRILIATSDENITTCRIEAVWGKSLTDRRAGDEMPISGNLMGDVLVGGQTMVFDEHSIHDAMQRDRRL